MKLIITVEEKDILEFYNNFCEDNEVTTISLSDYKTAFEKNLEATFSANIEAGWGFSLDNFVFEVEDILMKVK